MFFRARTSKVGLGSGQRLPTFFWWRGKTFQLWTSRELATLTANSGKLCFLLVWQSNYQRIECFAISRNLQSAIFSKSNFLCIESGLDLNATGSRDCKQYAGDVLKNIFFLKSSTQIMEGIKIVQK